MKQLCLFASFVGFLAPTNVCISAFETINKFVLRNPRSSVQHPNHDHDNYESFHLKTRNERSKILSMSVANDDDDVMSGIQPVRRRQIIQQLLIGSGSGSYLGMMMKVPKASALSYDSNGKPRLGGLPNKIRAVGNIMVRSFFLS